jgi:hypothetical protein
MTMGEKYSPGMAITEQAEADRYFEVCVLHHLAIAPEHSRQEAEEIERSNLAYFAGYYDSETRRRVEKLFKAVHPIFGSIEKHGEVTPEVAFEMGKIWGGGSKN